MKSRICAIKCPMCGTTLVGIEIGEEVRGLFHHKCGKCKRLWSVDYTQSIITLVSGKIERTPIKKWKLALETGESAPYIH